MKFTSVAEVEKALEPYYSITKRVTGTDSSVTRTKRLLAHFGNPQLRFRSIHIAGTSGKTSTAYYTAALFTAAGVRTGLMVSPHIDSITERIQLDGMPIADDLFCEYASVFLDRLTDFSEKPAWHECITALTFWIFAQEKVQYAVVETMLGGLHDPTNVLESGEKLCVLTDIGYDHMAILGRRIEEIAYQKAGIIHDNNAAIMYGQSDAIMQVVRYWTSQQENAEVYPFEQWRLEKAYKGTYEPSLANYQKRNWLLAFAAYLFVARRDSLKIITDKQMQKSQAVHIPARMDVVVADGKTIIMDGAHNEQKMQAFVQSFQAKYPGQKAPVLLALKKDKQEVIEEISAALAVISSEIIVTLFPEVPGLPIAPTPTRDIAQAFSAQAVPVREANNLTEAYTLLLATKSKLSIITGSFYLIAALRHEYPELLSIE